MAIGLKHRVYQCGEMWGCPCLKREFKEGDIVAFLYNSSDMSPFWDRGDLAILVEKGDIDDIVDERTGHKSQHKHWSVVIQKTLEYVNDIVEGEIDFAEDVKVSGD